MSATYTLSAAMIFRIRNSSSPLRIGPNFSLTLMSRCGSPFLQYSTFLSQGTGVVHGYRPLESRSIALLGSSPGSTPGLVAHRARCHLGAASQGAAPAVA